MHDFRRIENIALVGFMGTGKTTVGHVLAGLLHFDMVDTDDLIQSNCGRSISEIFRLEGEAKFRQYERDVVAGLQERRRVVIATGGGLAADASNLNSLKSHALVVCLWASAEAIWERVHRQTHRPLRTIRTRSQNPAPPRATGAFLSAGRRAREYGTPLSAGGRAASSSSIPPRPRRFARETHPQTPGA